MRKYIPRQDAQFKLRFKFNGTSFEGRIWAHEIGQALERAPGKLLPGYLWAKFSDLAGAQVDFDLDFDADPDGARAALVDATTAVLSPPPRTPLTKENILKWAEAHVGRFPTREKELWDKDKKEFVTEIVPTTVEWQLAQLLLAHDSYNYESYKGQELRELLLDWHYDGLKGYKDYTKEQLLDDIWNEICDPDTSSYDLNDLEDFLKLCFESV